MLAAAAGLLLLFSVSFIDIQLAHAATIPWAHFHTFDVQFHAVGALGIYNGKLYAGVGDTVSNAAVYVFNGTSWVLSRDFSGGYRYVNDFVEYEGKLYAALAGDGGSGGADVWAFDGSAWSLSKDFGTGYGETAVFKVFEQKLYAGTGYNSDKGDVWVYDGVSWSLQQDFGPQYELVDSFAIYNNVLYAGTGEGNDDADVFAFDGSSWTKVQDFGVAYGRVPSLEVFGGKLYAGLGWLADDGDVWAFDGSSWILVKDFGPGIWQIPSLAVYKDTLFAGLGFETGDGDVWAFDGSSWTLHKDFGPSFEAVRSLLWAGGRLYAGLGDEQASIYMYGEEGDYNAFGWAWSETIGWISFHRKDCDADQNGFSDGVPAGCPEAGTLITDYGVQVDAATGMFSGYAWSENVGWVKFDAAGPYPEAPGYSACLDLPGAGQVCDGVGNYTISGWARACAGAAKKTSCKGFDQDMHNGGWDGWIKLRGVTTGGNPYGIKWNPGTKEVEEWAWGSDVIGWVSFNCLNMGTCGTSDYKVIIDLGAPANSPPSAAISCTPGDCTTWKSGSTLNPPLTLNNDSTDADGIGDIVKSTWSGDLNPPLECVPPNARCDYAVQPIMPVGTYTAQLRVEDSVASSDTAVIFDVKIKRDAVANFDCSLDQVAWQPCAALKPFQGQPVYFRDLSLPSEDGTAIVGWSWTFEDGSPSSASISNPSTEFQALGSKTVTLTVVDNAPSSRSASATITLNPIIPFPEWKEISPF